MLNQNFFRLPSVEIDPDVDEVFFADKQINEQALKLAELLLLQDVSSTKSN